MYKWFNYIFFKEHFYTTEDQMLVFKCNQCISIDIKLSFESCFLPPSSFQYSSNALLPNLNTATYIVFCEIFYHETEQKRELKRQPFLSRLLLLLLSHIYEILITASPRLIKGVSILFKVFTALISPRHSSNIKKCKEY